MVRGPFVCRLCGHTDTDHLPPRYAAALATTVRLCIARDACPCMEYEPVDPGTQ